MSSNITKKLVTIGDAQVGKSSLLYRLVHKQTPNINSATIGAAFYCTELKNCRLNMWDTAGQERFRSMVPVYLRDTDIILFVYDISDMKSFQHLRDYWVDFALRHAYKDGHQKYNHTMSLPQLPKRSISYNANEKIEMGSIKSKSNEYYVNENGPLCVIVANKCDLSNNVVPNSEGIELAKKIGGSFIETSAKIGTNTEKLLKYIEDSLGSQELNNEKETIIVTNNDGQGLVILHEAKNYISDMVISPVSNCSC
jgi:GTPase SAR1 family protein